MAQDANDNSLARSLLGVMRRAEPRATDLTDLTRLTGGASQETWRFRLTGEGLDVPLILRRVPNNVPTAQQIGPEAEADVIRKAEQVGVPVPHIRLELEPADELGRGFVTDFVSGETLHRKVQDPAFAPARARFATQCGEILARIHSIDIAGLDYFPTLTAADQLRHLREVYDGQTRRSAIWELGFAWMARRLPDIPARHALVHGDYRMGNLLIAPDGIAAVLDWELSHLGNPIEDLGYLTINSWRFGAIDRPVGGVGTVEDLLAGYRAAGGEAVHPEEILFWRALGTMKWGILSGEMARAVGFRALTLERAVIGRRASECEIDLLDIIEGTGP